MSANARSTQQTGSTTMRFLAGARHPVSASVYLEAINQRRERIVGPSLKEGTNNTPALDIMEYQRLVDESQLFRPNLGRLCFSIPIVKKSLVVPGLALFPVVVFMIALVYG